MRSETFRERQKKLAGYLRAEGIDLAVIEDTEGRRSSLVRYFSGHPMDAILFVFSAGKVILVPWDVILAESCAAADEIIPYTDFRRLFTEALKGVCEREGLSRGAKIELSSRTPYLLYGQVEEALPGMGIVCRRNGFEAFAEREKTVKDKQETEHIVKACAVTDAIIDDVERLYRNGAFATELEVAMHIEKVCRELGAEGTGFETIAAGPRRSSGIHAFPAFTNSEFGTEGCSILDFGVKVEGYTSDVTMTIASGALSDRSRYMMHLVQGAYDLAVSLLKPGESSFAIAKAIDDYFDAEGYFMPHALGHGIGLDAHEQPIFRNREDSDTVLLPGMIVAIEPGLYHPEAGGVRLENDFLISEQGARQLTHSRFIIC